MTDFSAFLNPEQLAAATAGDGPLLVLAAAGTGKTQTLVYRVAYLVERGLPPESILLLTFTNRAAREMLERAHGVAGDAVGAVWSGTFHHVCNRMLRRHAPKLGYRHEFVIADRDDARKLIDDCVKELKLGGKDFPRREVLNSLFSHAANRALPVEDILESRLDQLKVDPMDIVRVHDRYEQRKHELGIMDFDDLLVNGLRLIEEHADVRERYQAQFRHILVDEYQDTNLLQARLVDRLAEREGNVMAVGDDFQCIYSWRGADFRNIMDFPRRYPAASIVKLERNYRSVPEILAVANACIAGNPEQFQKTLRATRPGGRKPRAMFLRDGREQAGAVVDLIRRGLQEGRALRDMAVLYRAHFHSIELQLELTRAGIAHVITSGVGVFEQAHVKDVLALLRVAQDGQDRLAFDRLLSLLPGVGPRSVATYWLKLGSRFDSRDKAQREALAALIKPGARETWEPIGEALARFHDGDEAGHPDKLVERFVAGFYAAYLEKTYENAKERLEDVQELAVQIMRSTSLGAFLQEVALLTNTDQAYDKDPHKRADAVRLSTVHQAKGLEWPVVFILWATEGMFPSSRSLGETEDDAEERRLFYVAATRARDELNICVPEWRQTRDGGIFACKPSRFVAELPNELLRSVYGRRY
ncbi:MAG: ATP-dependent helicase [Kiritimatiellae bacterium]|nr:ATP-dependent helicase [Kiritimatiellia bacterium]